MSPKKTNGAVQEPPKVPANMLDMSPGELMKAMGGNGWFNPESNDMITWMLRETDEDSVPRVIYQMYAWLKCYTTMEGNRQPYANKQGKELHLVHMAQDLGVRDMDNMRSYWRIGLKLGIWRGGTQAEGTKRLYLCAKVAPVVNADDKKSSKQVCTNLLPTIFQSLRPYMTEQLERLAPDVLKQAAERYERIEKVEKLAHSDLVAALRIMTDHQKHTLWRELGIVKKQLKDEEEIDADRKARLEPLLPQVERFVQTCFEAVQTQDPGLYVGENGSVQTAPAAPSLLGSETSEIPDLRAGGDLNRQTVKNGHSKLKEGERAVQVHAGEEADAKQPNTAEREKAVRLLNLLRKLFESQPRRFSGERPNPKNKGDVATAVKIVRALGSEPVEAFARYVEQKAGSRALGYRLTLALISELPEDYHDALAEERELEARRREQEEKARVLAEAAAKRMEEAEAEDARYEAMFRELPEEERSRRLAIAEQELKATPRWKNVLRYRDDLRQIEIENRALQVFRSEKRAEAIRQENEELLRQVKQGKGAAS